MKPLGETAKVPKSVTLPERKRCPRERSKMWKPVEVCRECEKWGKCKAWRGYGVSENKAGTTKG